MGVLSLVNLWSGQLGWDSWANVDELFNALFSGQSGLSLLGVGVSASIFYVLCFRGTRHQIYGIISGAVVAMAGCLIAVVASLINRENQFDATTATSMLGFVALSAVAGCVAMVRLPLPEFLSPDSNPTRRDALIEQIWSLPIIASAALVFALIHALYWNLSLADRIDRASFSIGANWILIAAVHAIVMSLAAWSARQLEQPSGWGPLHDKTRPVHSLIADGIWRSFFMVQLCHAVGAFSSGLMTRQVWQQSFPFCFR